MIVEKGLNRNEWIFRNNKKYSETVMYGLLVYSSEVVITEELIYKNFDIQRMVDLAGEGIIVTKISDGYIHREICASKFHKINFEGDHLKSIDVLWAMARCKATTIFTKHKA